MTTVDEPGVVTGPSLSQIVTDAVRTFRTQVPDCTIAALVDMSTGMLLAADTLVDRPADDLDLFAAATFDLFQGRNVEIIAGALADGPPARNFFREMVAQSDELLNIFLRSRVNDDLVAVVVCGRPRNLGMSLAQARRVMKQLDAGLGG